MTREDPKKLFLGKVIFPIGTSAAQSQMEDAVMDYMLWRTFSFACNRGDNPQWLTHKAICGLLWSEGQKTKDVPRLLRDSIYASTFPSRSSINSHGFFLSLAFLRGTEQLPAVTDSICDFIYGLEKRGLTSVTLDKSPMFCPSWTIWSNW